MNTDKIEGGLRKTSGQIEEVVGRSTKDQQMTGQGLYDKAAGVAQGAYGQAKDAVASSASAIAQSAREAVDSTGENLSQTAVIAQDQFASFEADLEKRIRKNPLVAVGVALGIGVLLGKMT